MNKILSVAVVSALGLASGVAVASPKYGDVARVVASTPVYERYSEPRQQCWSQPVTTYETRPVHTGYAARPAVGPGTVIGAVLGGVIGHQMGGSDRARDAATVAGVLIGGAVGNSADRHNGVGYVSQPTYYPQQVAVTREVQRCTTVAQVSQRIVGYDVRYVYAGREFVTRMPHAPGRHLRVNVDVYPNGHGNGNGHGRHGYGPRTPVYVR